MHQARADPAATPVDQDPAVAEAGGLGAAEDPDSVAGVPVDPDQAAGIPLATAKTNICRGVDLLDLPFRNAIFSLH